MSEILPHQFICINIKTEHYLFELSLKQAGMKLLEILPVMASLPLSPPSASWMFAQCGRNNQQFWKIPGGFHEKIMTQLELVQNFKQSDH